MAELTIAQIEAELRERDQEALESYRHGTGEAPILYSANFTGKAEGEGAGMVFVASEESPDRIGDILSIDGWDIKEYQRNPVMLFAHQHGILPPARAGRVWIDGKQLLNTVQFDDSDPLGAALKTKYEAGVMRGESVGFRPIEFKERPDGGRGILFTKQELTEISLVSVPMHPKALRKMLGDAPFTIVVPSKAVEIMHVSPPADTKVGRVLSKANRGKLGRAHELLAQVLAATAEGDDDGDDKPKDDKGHEPNGTTVASGTTVRIDNDDDDTPVVKAPDEPEPIDWDAILEAVGKTKEELQSHGD